MLQFPVIRFRNVTLVGTICGFAFFCGVDYFLVRCVPYPDQIHDLDWTAGAFLLIQFIAAFVVCKKSFLAALASSFLASFGAVVLIFLFGFPFHFAIGGSL